MQCLGHFVLSARRYQNSVVLRVVQQVSEIGRFVDFHPGDVRIFALNPFAQLLHNEMSAGYGMIREENEYGGGSYLFQRPDRFFHVGNLNGNNVHSLSSGYAPDAVDSEMIYKNLPKFAATDRESLEFVQ